MIHLTNRPDGQRVSFENIIDRRILVNTLVDWDEENGIARSQRAKYERPAWALLGSLINGCDGKELTCEDLQAKLLRHNIRMTTFAIYKALCVMESPKPSYRSHRRNCGVSCEDAMISLGRLKHKPVMKISGGSLHTFNAYYFGESQENVVTQKRAIGLTMQVRP